MNRNNNNNCSRILDIIRYSTRIRQHQQQEEEEKFQNQDVSQWNKHDRYYSSNRRSVLVRIIIPVLIMLASSSSSSLQHVSLINAFIIIQPQTKYKQHYERATPTSHRTPYITSRTGTQLRMVFDFIKERSREGLNQLDQFSSAALRGDIKGAFQNVAQYTQQTNEAFAIGLTKSRNQFLANLESVFTGVSSDEVLDNLQDILIQADLGSSTAEDIVNEVKSLRADSTVMISQKDLKSILRGKLLEAFESTAHTNTLNFAPADSTIPTIYLVIGANGMGKTTTIGKLAYKLQNEYGLSVLMVAGDTFRAGAVEQLQLWSNRVGCDIVMPDDVAAKSPAAVLYKALDTALKPKTITIERTVVPDPSQPSVTQLVNETITKPYSYDVVLVDTSGRLSNNEALTAELVKMKKVLQKRCSVQQQLDENTGKMVAVPNGDVPHETLLVIDASQGGRMALQSTQIWDTELGGISGLILTKLDGTARGGSVVAISRDLTIPVKFVGIGEQITDLQEFDRERYVDSLLGIGTGTVTSTNAKTAASNKQAVNEEAKQLALRLQELRKEREERAKVAKATIVGKQQTFGSPQQLTNPTLSNTVTAGVTPLSSIAATKSSNPTKKKSNNNNKNKKRKK